MEENLLKVFKNKNVLVTGHTGFKGSWLVIWLLKLGANVIGYSLDPKTEKDNYVLSKLEDKIIDVRGDIRDFDKLNEVFEKYKPEIVFHLAAQPLVRYSYRYPRDTYDVNVIGAVNILECIRKYKETKVGVIITSDKCYKNNEWVWGYREEDRLGGYDPYSCSKSCVELLVASYKDSFFTEDNYLSNGKVIASARAGNVIGGGDWSEDRLIPDCIRALEEKNDIVIRSPNAIRPWQHVLEPLSGYLMLAAKMYLEGLEYTGAWNFGPEYKNIVNVSQLVERIVNVWGEGVIKLINTKKDLHEAKLLSLDINKAKYYLEWFPKWDIDMTINKTIEWYKIYSEIDVFNLCQKQIDEYTL